MIGRITLEVKCAGARSAGNPHAACDVAGAGDGATVGPTWARRGKPRIRTRVHPDGQPRQLSTLPHFCTYSRKFGSFVIGRKTIKKRLRARLQFLKVELRRRMHDPIARTGAWLRRVLQGHLNYFSVSGNDRILWAFFQQVRWYWLRTLRRRSQRGYFNWDQFVRRTTRFFPKIRVMHPYPLVRFDARTQGRSPVR